jgi:hypothetical protein
MKMTIEKAIQLARGAAAERPLTVIGGRKAALAEIVAARHASNFGQTDDKWFILFRIDWQGARISPDSLVAYVDSDTEEVAFPEGI